MCALDYASDAHHGYAKEICFGVFGDGAPKYAALGGHAENDEDAQEHEFSETEEEDNFADCGRAGDAQGQVGEEEGEAQGGEGGEEP